MTKNEDDEIEFINATPNEDEGADDDASDVERQIKKSQMERSARRSKMLIKQLRTLLGFILLAAICLGTYKFVTYHGWYLSPDVLDKSENNPEIEIQGNKLTSNDKILSALRRVELPSKPIYLIDTSKMEQNIKLLEPVRRVYIRRFAFPARLLIRVEERVPVLTVSPKPDVTPIAFFTADGKLIGRDYMPLDSSYKTYLVLSYGILGDDYHTWNSEKINSIVKLAQEMERLSGEKVAFLDFRNPKDIYIQLESASVRIGEMDDTVYKRIKNIGSILPTIQTLKNKKVKYIDLRWETNYLKLDNPGGAIKTED